MLIDQRRAHIRVLFEQYVQQMGHQQGATQHELFPERVDVAPQDVPHLEAIMPELRALGFDLDSLGGGAYVVNGKPASLGAGVDLTALLLQMVEAARDEVLRFMKQYLEKHDIGGELKVWTAGHSRGGAVANLLGGFLAASTTDFIQSIVMSIALIIILCFGVSQRLEDNPRIASHSNQNRQIACSSGRNQTETALQRERPDILT